MVYKRSWPLPLPLLLPLLLVWLSGRSVLGRQSVSTFHVATTYVNITWERDWQWENVKSFTVSLAFDDVKDCDKVVECDSDVCHFSSLEECGEFPACYSLSLSVSGGGHTTPVYPLVTAPEKIAKLTLRQEEDIEYISWDNPSPQSSHCHSTTDVRISYNGFSITNSYPAAEQSVTLPLCVAGSGSVEVWAGNGHGLSDGAWGDFTYVSDKQVLVHIKSCKPLNCSAGQVDWELKTSCPAGKYIMVDSVSSLYSVDINETSFVIPGLGLHNFYNTCVLVMTQDLRSILGGDCIYWEIKRDVVQNLTFDDVTATSVTVLWDRSECPHSTLPEYCVTKTVAGVDETVRTSYTSYTWNNLDALTEYKMSVSVDPCTQEFPSLSKDVFTLPGPPTQLQVSVINTTAVYVSWAWENKDQDVLFNVSWGNDSNNNILTSSNSYTIDVSGDSGAVDTLQVCVAAIVTSLGNLTSEQACGKPSPSTPADNYVVPIVVGAMMGGILLVLAAVGTVFFIRKRRNSI